MSDKRGFTLIEVLVVVIILGILAAVVIPQLSTASVAAQTSMLADHIRTSRMQILTFKWQHLGVPPGYPDLDENQTPTEEAFLEHMTQASTAEGDVAAPGTDGYVYGPYMTPFPTNPINGKAGIQMIADDGTLPDSADDSHGWIYQPGTMTLKTDATGADQSGKAYFDF